MPAFPPQNSSSPATQANRTPIACVSQAPRKPSFAPSAFISAIVLQSIEQIEALPAFCALPANCSLRARLAPLFASTRQLVAVSSADPLSINAKLGKIEALISDLNKKTQPQNQATYAQVARAGTTSVSPAFAPLLAAPIETTRESKQLLVKIAQHDSTTLKNTSPEQIVKRLEGDSELPAVRGIIAAKRLPSGDVILHLNEASDKARLQSNTEWTKKLCPSAKIHTKTFPVLVHGVSTAGRLRDDPSSLARSIEADNAKRHPGLKVKKTSWLKKIDDNKRFSSLIVEVTNPAQANRMITEGVILRYELKTAERFDRRCRIMQCYKCQQYGKHLSFACKNTERCSNCGQEHKSAACTTNTHTNPRCCAACNGANHPSWSTQCPARIQDAARARRAKDSCPLLFPLPAQPSKSPQPTQAFSPSGASSSPALSQLTVPDSQHEWITQEFGSKKRRLMKPTGRPPKPPTIDIDFGAIHAFVSPAGSKPNASETPLPPSPSQDSFFECTPTESNASNSL
jgi:hypothetical protein